MRLRFTDEIEQLISKGQLTKLPGSEPGSCSGCVGLSDHKRLDQAIFAAYGWKSDLSDEEILEKLLSLNLERAREYK